MAASDDPRLSVLSVDVHPGREHDVQVLSRQFKDVMERKKYARVDMIKDEAVPTRFYAVTIWVNADAARKAHSDRELSDLRFQLYQGALVTHVINGVRDRAVSTPVDRRTPLERDRRGGFDRRIENIGRIEGDRRVTGIDRRIGPRRQRERTVDLTGAARLARENAKAAFSNFRVGAALETSDGVIVTGCNIENATYGLTVCAERVAMFKALSDGHKSFTRIAIVADTEDPTPPCGACRQILWEFGGNLEVRLANLTMETGTHRLKDLLPLPFDARLL